MVRALLRRLFLALVRLYYPRRVVEGAEGIPAGPVILVANHPNGLLDPALLRLAVGRSVRILAKSTLFKNPFGRLAMGAFEAIPIYRSQDGGGGKAMAAGNEATFTLCREALAAGQWLALFPEGTSHSDPQLRPLKTGAARIALSAAAGMAARPGGPLDLAVVPVGLCYEAKATFRSAVLAVAGQPLRVSERLAAYAADERATVERFTDEIRAALDEVVLQAETRDLVAGVARVAAWTAADPGRAADPVAQNRRARELLDAYQALRARDPERVERVVREARHYARILGRLGVSDPWALEMEAVSLGRALGALGRLVIGLPLAVVGAALGWLPYRLAGRVAGRVAKEEDVLGTVKLVAGAVFLLVAWLLEAGAARVAGLGTATSVGVLVAGPVTGYAALRVEELWRETREALRHVWLRAAHPRKVQRLSERRRALAAQVTGALLEAAPGPVTAVAP
jgi:glycerol-3-phosphate O-acyltransferase/dihydroxyacetone phosphate acyltransferase